MTEDASARCSSAMSELEQAERSFRSSRILLHDGDINGATNRLYYALFHAARAALISEGIQLPRSHAGLIAAFGSQLVKTGRIDLSLGKLLNRAEHERLLADYSSETTNPEVLSQLINESAKFITAVRTLVQQDPSAPSS